MNDLLYKLGKHVLRLGLVALWGVVCLRLIAGLFHGTTFEIREAERLGQSVDVQTLKTQDRNLDVAVMLWPFDYLAWDDLGYFNLVLGDRETDTAVQGRLYLKAVAAFEQSVKYAPHYSPAWARLAHAHARLGNHASGAQAFERSVRTGAHHPSSLQMHVSFGSKEWKSLSPQLRELAVQQAVNLWISGWNDRIIRRFVLNGPSEFRQKFVANLPFEEKKRLFQAVLAG